MNPSLIFFFCKILLQVSEGGIKTGNHGVCDEIDSQRSGRANLMVMGTLAFSTLQFSFLLFCVCLKMKQLKYFPYIYLTSLKDLFVD